MVFEQTDSSEQPEQSLDKSEFIQDAALTMSAAFDTIDTDGGGVSEEELSSAISRMPEDDSRREHLRFVQDKYDEIRNLDHWFFQADEIEADDVKFLTDLSYQTNLDRKHFDNARQTALANFDNIDTDDDGELSSKELGQFAEESSLTSEERQAVGYLTRRAAGDYSIDSEMREDANERPGIELGFSDYDNVEHFYSRSFSREDLRSLSLKDRIEQTNNAIFARKVIDDWEGGGALVGWASGVAAGVYLLPVLGPGAWHAPAVTGGAGFYAGSFIGRRIGFARAENYYEQTQKHRVRRLFS